MGNPAADLLGSFLRTPSISGGEAAFTQQVANWGVENGFEVDLWQADESELARYPEGRARHIPLAGRPTLVLKLPGSGNGGRKGEGGGKSLLFNAHADVVPAGDLASWTHDPWSGAVVDGKIFGRGACDVKGPLVSCLLAMSRLRAAPVSGDVLLEVVPGEEDCVGLGTLTSVARGYRADGCIVLEPTEGQPRCASRGGMRFEISIEGKSVHGTMKWLGADAIATARRVLDQLEILEREWNDPEADTLYGGVPYARPITVDSIKGGQWQGMLCDKCIISGYLELLPRDELIRWGSQLRNELCSKVDCNVSLIFSEEYAGHRTPPGSAICRAAEAAVGPIRWQGFNSGCEAGIRPRLFATPTLVWGPGSLAQAHCADEFVALDEVTLAAERMERFAREWCR